MRHTLLSTGFTQLAGPDAVGFTAGSALFGVGARDGIGLGGIIYKWVEADQLLNRSKGQARNILKLVSRDTDYPPISMEPVKKWITPLNIKAGRDEFFHVNDGSYIRPETINACRGLS